MGRLEIDRNSGSIHRAQRRAERVERSAFQPVAREDQFARGGFFCGGDADIFERLPFGGLEDFGRPVVLPATIRWGEGMRGEAKLFEKWEPPAIRARFRPRAATEGKDYRIGFGADAVFKNELEWPTGI